MSANELSSLPPKEARIEHAINGGNPLPSLRFADESKTFTYLKYIPEIGSISVEKKFKKLVFHPKEYNLRFNVIKDFLTGLRDKVRIPAFGEISERENRLARLAFRVILKSEHGNKIIGPDDPKLWQLREYNETFNQTFKGFNKEAYQLLKLAYPIFGEDGVNELISQEIDLSVESGVMQAVALCGRRGHLKWENINRLRTTLQQFVAEKRPGTEDANLAGISQFTIREGEKLLIRSEKKFNDRKLRNF